MVNKNRTSIIVATTGLVLIGAVAWVKTGTTLLAITPTPITWDSVFGWIRHDWPEVPQMTTAELAQRMAVHDATAPFLVDLRTRKEYEVSHLPGAVWAESSDEIAAVLRTIPPQQLVVLYCSVGVRSSKAAANLIRLGRVNVFNLRGSIFEWANEGRPLRANDQAVHVVHPYNERWGVLLYPQLHPSGS